jgi:hypothetical protein
MNVKTLYCYIGNDTEATLAELDAETNRLLIRAESPSTGITTFHDVRDITDTVTHLGKFGPHDRLLITRRITFR